MATIIKFFESQVNEELAAWLGKVGAPSSVKVATVRTREVEPRHKTVGFAWDAMLTDGSGCAGWMSFDGAQFDIDTRPDV